MVELHESWSLDDWLDAHLSLDLYEELSARSAERGKG